MFLGVFSAQHISNLYHDDREKEHILNLLRATHMQLEKFNEEFAFIPASYSNAKEHIRGYQPSNLFKDNVLKLPPIVNTTLSDTNILRVMHPQSISTIFDSLHNAKKSLGIFSKAEISEYELQNLINLSLVHLKALSKSVEFEIMYQRGEVSEEEFFDLHREHIKQLENNPMQSLIKIK